jgi:hypothetical protein
MSIISDQGNEADCSKLLLPHPSVALPAHPDEGLWAVPLADRHDEARTGRKLVDERLRDMLSRRSDEDRVIG